MLKVAGKRTERCLALQKIDLLYLGTVKRMMLRRMKWVS